MVKKLKKVGASEGHLAATVKESASQIWLAGLGAFAKAQEEGGKLFDKLVEEGEALQGRTRESSAHKIHEVKDKAAGTWDKLEQVFEERVARALERLSIPTKEDVRGLSERLDELSASVKELTAKQGMPAPPKRGNKAADATGDSPST